MTERLRRRKSDAADIVRLRACAEQKLCPSCGQEYDVGRGYGSGRLDDGLFCSLDCFAKFHYAQ